MRCGQTPTPPITRHKQHAAPMANRGGVLGRFYLHPPRREMIWAKGEGIVGLL